MPTREECLAKAGDQIAEHVILNAARSPRELAEAAWHPNSPFTVDEIEDRIRAKRGLSPVHTNRAS